MKCPGTPSSNYVGPSKLPPWRPTFKKQMRSSSVQKSKSCPIPECLKKIEDCIRELLGYVEECANAQMSRKAEDSHYDINNIVNSMSNIGASLENSGDGYNEILIVEKKGQTLNVNLKCSCGAVYQTMIVEMKGKNFKVNLTCPCSACYQILLLEGICYYKIV
ncbi:hypothetical protein OWV82_006568 [Melia azedarach]|uniref:Uncharacterized protein n=2 Tax=Melia azedarach TaxID=155640 RepID=A0ACC1YIB2_MELAZ|nr:hypothetical protein OWV82_006567 [Melia azedarach]KAJ4723162.1 hypothetical protein OWV82_006568 [Melia azedarach]